MPSRRLQILELLGSVFVGVGPVGQRCPEIFYRFFLVFRRCRKSPGTFGKLIKRCHQLGRINQVIRHLRIILVM